MQVPNGTGPGVRMSKRPLLASRTRCNVLWKPPKFGNKVEIGNKVQFGNKFANWCNVWSIEGVIVHGHVPECHVTFLHQSLQERKLTYCNSLVFVCNKLDLQLSRVYAARTEGQKLLCGYVGSFSQNLCQRTFLVLLFLSLQYAHYMISSNHQSFAHPPPPRGDAGGLSREYVLRIPSVS